MGAQAAVVLPPVAVTRKLCAMGRLRVGLVYARVRPSDLPMRCFLSATLLATWRGSARVMIVDPAAGAAARLAIFPVPA